MLDPVLYGLRGRCVRRWLAPVLLLLASGAGLGLPRAALGSSRDAFDALAPLLTDPGQGPLVPTPLHPRAEPVPRARGPWLAVGGGMASSPGQRRRVFALVELGIPLGALAGGGPSPGPEDDLAGNGPSAAPDDDERASVAEPIASAASSDGGVRMPEAAPITSPASGFDGLRLALAADDAARGQGAVSEVRRAPASSSASSNTPWGCGEARSCDPAALMPLARATVAEALRVQGAPLELRRLDGMAARSRAAASLPEVRLGAGTSRDESLRLAPTAADPARFTRDGGRDLWLEARLTWRLDAAIFARDEVAIMRLHAEQRKEQARLAAEVIEALVAFERARSRLSSDLSAPEEREQALGVQYGALVRLDVLTDGWFSRRLEQARSTGREAWP